MRVGVANAVAAVGVFVYQNYLAPPTEAGADDLQRSVVAFAVFMAIVFPAAALVAQRLLRPLAGVVTSTREPTRADRRTVLLVPPSLAVMAFQFWLLAIVVFGVLNAVSGVSALELARSFVGTLLGGLIAALLTFLLVEQRMRPVFAAVLRGEPAARQATLGIRPRLLLAWGLGSGVPLLAIAGSQVRPPGTPEATPEAILFLAVVGLGVGAFLVGIAARSVTEPLERVRSALGRVEQGDISVEIPVDDGGEIGRLQGQFNQMVIGLRERRRLEDLFGRHVGPEVAALAVARGMALGGETRTASVLFVDLIASTALAAARPPEEVVSLLNRFFSTVVRTVTAEGGWVNKFEGDGALCVFGAPAAHDDHAARALRAARQLHAALVALSADHPDLDAGIGVSSGKVVAGNVGSEERYEYTVIGDPVNEAARLTEEAKRHAGRVLGSEPTVEAAGPEASYWSPVAELTLRGRDRPTKAYAPI